MIKQLIAELKKVSADEYFRLDYLRSMAKAYSDYSDTYDKADELLTRFIMTKFPDCVMDNAIDVSEYKRISERIIESFTEYVKGINCDWRGHEKEHISTVGHLLRMEDQGMYPYEKINCIEVAEESQRVECLKSVFDYLHYLEAGTIQLTYTDDIILAYAEGCTLSAKEVLLLTQSNDKRAYMMHPAYGIAKDIHICEENGYKFTIRKDAVKPEWLRHTTVQCGPGLVITLSLHDGVKGDELINSFRKAYESSDLLHNVSFYKDEGTVTEVKLIGVHGGASYPILKDSDGNNDPGVFIVAETAMDVVTAEKLQEFVKSADISSEDTDVEYILSVGDDEFCIMNTTSDVKDEWKPMDLTKIDEWVNAGFVIEGVTKDKYTDLLKMYCEMNSQNTEDKFNAADYLKDYMDILPPASVVACTTKEDCDSLLKRLGLK